VARLEKLSDLIRPDLIECAHARTSSTSAQVPPQVPVNDMAPPVKQRHGVRYSAHLVIVLRPDFLAMSRLKLFCRFRMTGRCTSRFQNRHWSLRILVHL